MVLGRYIMIALGLTAPLVAGVFAWGGDRLVRTLDKVVEKQDDSSRSVVEIKARLEGLINGTAASVKVLNDRIDGIDKSTTSRFDAQGHWLQKNSEELDRLKEQLWKLPAGGPK